MSPKHAFICFTNFQLIENWLYVPLQKLSKISTWKNSKKRPQKIWKKQNIVFERRAFIFDIYSSQTTANSSAMTSLWHRLFSQTILFKTCGDFFLSTFVLADRDIPKMSIKYTIGNTIASNILYSKSSCNWVSTKAQ